MPNEWRDLYARLDRIMAMRDELQDHDSPIDEIRRPRHIVRYKFKAKRERLRRLEKELPEFIEAAFQTGNERNKIKENL